MSEEDEILAAEYVLGTLEADERTVVASVMTHDPAMRRAVTRWEARLAPLSAVVPDVAPPPEVWERIEDALFEGRGPTAFSIIEGGLEEERAGVARLEDVRANERARLRRSRDFWRSLALGAGALAASLAILVADREILRRPEPQPSYVAVVNRGGDEPALIVRVDLASGQVFVRPVAAEVPSGKSLELWYIGEGKAPKSMGLVEKEPLRMALPEGAKVDKAVFAVTVEPEGGSPTGGPTGPVVYSGQLIRE